MTVDLKDEKDRNDESNGNSPEIVFNPFLLFLIQLLLILGFSTTIINMILEDRF